VVVVVRTVLNQLAILVIRQQAQLAELLTVPVVAAELIQVLVHLVVLPLVLLPTLKVVAVVQEMVVDMLPPAEAAQEVEELLLVVLV
jgi:hypothetical protein